MSGGSTQQTVICMKWGTRYGPEYVNRLASMVRRQTTRPTRLLCFTDNVTGISTDVETAPLPPIALPPGMTWSTWRKLSVWQYPLTDLEGDVLFLDLDLVLTGPLDGFFDYEPGSFAVIRNWTQFREGIGNTSVFRFPAGRYTRIYEDFVRDPIAVMRRWRTEQHYISDNIPDLAFWPAAWCVSFKHSLLPYWPMNFIRTAKLPRDAKVVVFTGKPKPDEALVGRWPTRSRRERIYKHTRPTPWIGEHWR